MFTMEQKIKILLNCFNSKNTKFLLENGGYLFKEELTEKGEQLFILVYEKVDCGMKLKAFL